MKKLLHALAGLLALQAAAVFADDKFETFVIQDVSGGAAKIKGEGASDFKAAQKGENCKAGTVGKTGDQSTIKVAFDAQNTFRILPNTEVKISTSTRDSKFRKVVDLTMEKGKVNVNLDAFPKEYQLKVQTPTAVCGAVGTSFTVDSDTATASTFTCDRGSIFAQSLDDESFSAPKIGKGQSLTAEVAPGKENSYTKLHPSSDMDIAVGSRDGKKIAVSEDSTILLAQEHGRSNQVALQVKNGKAGDHGKGAYLVDGDEVIDYGKKKDGADLVENYIVAAQKEGKLKSQFDRSPNDSKLKADLNKAADDATEKRNKMLEARKVMREAFGSGLRETMGGGGRPTAIPGGGRPGR